MSPRETLRFAATKSFLHNQLKDYTFDWKALSALRENNVTIAASQYFASAFDAQVGTGSQFFCVTLQNPDTNALVQGVHFTSTKIFTLGPSTAWPELNGSTQKVYLVPHEANADQVVATEGPTPVSLLSSLTYALPSAACCLRREGPKEEKIFVMRACPDDFGTAKGIACQGAYRSAYLIGDYDEKGRLPAAFDNLCTKTIISRNESVRTAIQRIADIFGVVGQIPVMLPRNQYPLGSLTR